MIFIDVWDGGKPKRGDLVHTNVGQKKERTWLILRARRMRSNSPYPRYQVHMARWWELEPEMRINLYRSATRNGGQRVIFFNRYPAKKKVRRTFEDYMARGVR